MWTKHWPPAPPYSCGQHQVKTTQVSPVISSQTLTHQRHSLCRAIHWSSSALCPSVSTICKNKNKTDLMFLYLCTHFRHRINLSFPLILLTSNTGLWSCGAAWDLVWGCSSSCRSLGYQRPAVSGPAPAYACCRESPSHETSSVPSCSGSLFEKMIKSYVWNKKYKQL